MPRRRKQQPRFDLDLLVGSGRYLAERLNVLAISRSEFARRLGKAEKDIGGWFGTRTQPPKRPRWESVQQIATVLDQNFEVVRIALGYRSPDEPAPTPLDDWERESRRLSRQLLTLLRRVPEGARPAVVLAISAMLNGLSVELVRLTEDDDELP